MLSGNFEGTLHAWMRIKVQVLVLVLVNAASSPEVNASFQRGCQECSGCLPETSLLQCLIVPGAD